MQCSPPEQIVPNPKSEIEEPNSNGKDKGPVDGTEDTIICVTYKKAVFSLSLKDNAHKFVYQH